MATVTEGNNGAVEYKYDVAVSFAGEQRPFVEAVVRATNLPPDRVFYDEDFTAELWGEDLVELFTRLYSKEARYVVMFISREYARKEWARVERRAALARRMRSQAAYILPVRCDTTELEEVNGLLNTIGYLDGQKLGPHGIADFLNKKLAIALALPDSTVKPDKPGKPQFAQIADDATGLAAVVYPAPDQIKIEVIVVEQKCFGSTGCRVTYRIKPTYIGPEPMANSSFTVVYTINGGDDPEIGNFTVSNGVVHSREDFINTPPNPTITAVATRVLPAQKTGLN
jgi:TIR domain